MKLLHPYILSQSNNYFGKCRIRKKKYKREGDNDTSKSKSNREILI